MEGATRGVKPLYVEAEINTKAVRCGAALARLRRLALLASQGPLPLLCCRQGLTRSRVDSDRPLPAAGQASAVLDDECREIKAARTPPLTLARSPLGSLRHNLVKLCYGYGRWGAVRLSGLARQEGKTGRENVRIAVIKGCGVVSEGCGDTPCGRGGGGATHHCGLPGLGQLLMVVVSIPGMVMAGGRREGREALMHPGLP
ncbi:hypothetical protein E2C01_001592 [Portunus trituberculatus]|uniref:Uncharacterized protein n=1 Tax=Portunus trituberculatus TaxID=210409 RepID=A0A5B7CH20_PORTR|nr:hypothetical protein [Portunus trituberculatus]